MDPKPTTVDAYLANLPPERQGPMAELRAAVRTAAPDAIEGIAYNMPAYRLGGRFLVSFDAFKRHYSLFPATDRILSEHPDGERFVAGRGTFRFAANEPLPLDFVGRAVRTRVAEVADELAGGETSASHSPG
jgi:uncharacterized protein YdhG (YjbR/CyaY superfamily)